MPDLRYIPFAELAARLGVSRHALYHHHQASRIRTEKRGRMLVVPRAEAERVTAIVARYGLRGLALA